MYSVALDYFELDPLTGELKILANMSLDREENEYIILNVTVNNTRPGVGCSINPNCKYFLILKYIALAEAILST